MSLKLMYITNNPLIAAIADRTGVDRVWIDLESLGKEARQHGMNTVKSNHLPEDVKTIKPILQNAQLMVRINPINPNTADEIDTVIDYGADIIMLPYYKTVDQVNTFLKCVNKRVKTILLLETKEAVEILDEVLKLEGVDEIHIGLNDLHLSYNKTFMFELLADGTVEKLCNKLRDNGIPYGFGGIAKLGEGLLPAEYVIAEHYRLHSGAAILSRSFYDSVDATDYEAIEEFFVESMAELRQYEDTLKSETDTFFAENQKKVCSIVDQIVKMRKEYEN